MFRKKCLVLVIACQITTTVLISNKLEDKIPHILFNLTNYAAESRQYGFASKYSPLANNDLNNYQNSASQNSVMNALALVVQNDALRCVPRLLCEVTSGTISRRDFSIPVPNLPFKIGMPSIIKLLSTLDLGSGLPVSVFGKAALLGYISKGNSDSCLDAYPKCPRDPNKLVQYLNNYNGGFFRFFNGAHQPHMKQYRPYRTEGAEKRILNRPHFAYLGEREQKQRLAFPQDKEILNEFTSRKPKELPFSISYYYSNELDLPRPLPNHRATPMIFPDRTGTGDLRMDFEELTENYHNDSPDSDLYKTRNPIFSFPGQA